MLREVWLIDCYAVSVLLKSRACACVFVGRMNNVEQRR